jgi:hypothetical protein
MQKKISPQTCAELVTTIVLFAGFAAVMVLKPRHSWDSEASEGSSRRWSDVEVIRLDGRDVVLAWAEGGEIGPTELRQIEAELRTKIHARTGFDESRYARRYSVMHATAVVDGGICTRCERNIVVTLFLMDERLCGEQVSYVRRQISSGADISVFDGGSPCISRWRYNPARRGFVCFDGVCPLELPQHDALERR